jgi:peptide/nickel transport system ATP-binding protein
MTIAPNPPQAHQAATRRSSNEPEALLEARDLRVGLDSDAGLVRALDGLTLSIEKGRTFALVGESGCGKSMTALALLRLLPENGRILGGEVRLQLGSRRIDLVDLTEAQMRSLRGGGIGIIFQEPSTSLNPVMRVGDQIVEAIEAHTALRGHAAKERALQWLSRVGIPDPARRFADYPFQLSGGQKQRVMIAIALAAEPKLLIADEPTTALDVTIQAQILDLLGQLQRELGMAMLLITHDLAVVSRQAEQVALMYAGQIVEVASADAFFRRPVHPYAQELLRALPDSARRGRRLASIAGTVPPLHLDFQGCRFADRCRWAQGPCRTAPPPFEAVADEGSDASPHHVRCARVAEIVATGPEPRAMADESRPRVETVVVANDAERAPLAKEPLLRVEQLRVEFPIRRGLLRREVGAFTAVDGIDLSVCAGETVALVGESGCGKSTTGKAILRLLGRSARIHGTVDWRGRSVLALSPAELRAVRSEVQIIFQDPFASLDPRMRVGEIIDEGLEALCPQLDARERRARIENLLERVGLRPDVYGRFPHEFSGGQRQRVAIARALAVEPKLIVCDEPTSALDVSVQAQILNLLAELQRDLGVAYLFVTHNFGVVEYFADRILVMQAGRIVESGDVGTVMRAPQHAYTQRLLAAVPRLKSSA